MLLKMGQRVISVIVMMVTTSLMIGLIAQDYVFFAIVFVVLVMVLILVIA